ncbi:Ig-like domain-containing protein [Vibrio splendidus]|uniref:Ig-like domain-containing protein n=1 Tax=Vibrio splendidus TaxID=29497 RepID=UPI00352CD79B
MMRINTYRNFQKLSLTVVISLVLLGCGGSSDEAAPKSTSEPSTLNDTLYYAQDVIRQSAPTNTFFVDLSNSIESSDGSPVTLTTVTPLNDNYDCNVVSQNTNGFTINAQSAKVCDYRYRVGSTMSSDIAISSHSSSNEARMSATSATSGDGFAEATVRAAVGESTEQLIPISGLTSSFTSVPIDIADELGNQGYSLDTSRYTLSATVTLPNSDATNSTAIANTSTNTINYTPGSGIPSGVERILYSYSDGSSVLTGSIDIAVSTDTNSAPTASSVQLNEFINPNTGETQSSVPWNQLLTIDVMSLINDPDGDVLQLIDVFSYGATVAILEDADGDENRFNDTQFTFLSTESGSKSVTYVVTDQKGGYATGVIQMRVATPYEPIGSMDPPLIELQAQAISAKYTPHGPGDGIKALDNLVNATFDIDAAAGICAAQGGSLPTNTELQVLYDKYPNGDLYHQHDWPVDLPYWTSSHELFDMYDGSISSTAEDGTSVYNACLVYDPQDITSIELYSDEVTEAVIPGELQSPQLKLTFYSGDEAIVDPKTIEFSDENLADIYQDKIRALKPGTLQVTLYYDEFSTTYTMTIIEPLTLLAGSTVMSVGESKEIRLAYSIDGGESYKTTKLDNLSSSNTSAVTAESHIAYSQLNAISEGVSTIIGTRLLNGIHYEATSEVTVFTEPWCYEDGIISTGVDAGRKLCLGYTQDVMSTSVANLVELYGGTSYNPYVEEQRYGRFCATFGLEAMYHRNDFPLHIDTADGNAIGHLSAISFWLTHEGYVLSGGNEDYSTYITLAGATPGNFGVPLCIYPEWAIVTKMGQ